MLMETEYQVDDTLVQQYFPMEIVTDGGFRNSFLRNLIFEH